MRCNVFNANNKENPADVRDNCYMLKIISVSVCINGTQNYQIIIEHAPTRKCNPNTSKSEKKRKKNRKM